MTTETKTGTLTRGAVASALTEAKAERDRLARVVSVMRGESEHLPEGWSVYLGEPPLCWSRDSVPVEAAVDPVMVDGVVKSYKMWTLTIDEEGGSGDVAVGVNTCPLSAMEELDRRYPPTA